MAAVEATSELVFYVNGNRIAVQNPDPEWTLLSYLRNKLRLVGSKLGCGEGGCGTCTVMLSVLSSGDTVRHYAANACLVLLSSLHGKAVTTVEGLGSCKTRLHPVQERIAKAHGSQCGFCTPGFVMSAYALLRSQPQPPTMEQLEDALVGNLCRCTGYRPILEGLKTLTVEGQTQTGCGRADCCKLEGNSSDELPADLEMTDVLFNPADFAPYDATQELIFPPELKLNPGMSSQALHFTGPRVTFFQVNELQSLLRIKLLHPDAKLVVGNTEIGVDVRLKGQLYPTIVSVCGVEELENLELQSDGLLVGAAVTITTLQDKLKEIMNQLPESQTRVFSAMLEMLRWFAGKQIRNVASIGGNIMTCSPISDLNPVLLAAGATLTLCSRNNGVRKVVLDQHFFKGYRKCAVAVDEVLLTVMIPFTKPGEYFAAYKQSRRRDDDIAIVNAAMRVNFQPNSTVVKSSYLAFGGVAATTILATNTMKNLQGQEWKSGGMPDQVISSLLKEVTVNPGAPGGMTSYRNALVPSFFFKFYLHVRHQLSIEFAGSVEPIQPDEQELLQPYTKPHHRAMHFYQKVSSQQELIDPVGRPVPHVSCLQQVTGEAVYIDDLPRYEDELFGTLVVSTKAKAKIVSIDATEALALQGVHRFVTAQDLPGDRNKMGPMFQDEEVFARNEVVCVGQVIGLIVADDRKLSFRAATMVKIEYTETNEKPIITIEDAIAAKSYSEPRSIWRGDATAAHVRADHTLNGEFRMGGQEHFYLEPNAHLAVPKECGGMEVFSCTQNPTDAQFAIASALGIPANRVLIRTKRIGGGFGGKETRPATVYVPAAVAAFITGRSVRVVLERPQDMMVTGTRHPFLARWKASFTVDGDLEAIEMNLYSNAGCYTDLSPIILDRAMFTSCNAYRCRNFRVTGYCCWTNLPSNTAFRGFGAPQGILIMEDIMASIASYLNKDPVEVRERNLNRVGDSTHYGQVLENCTVRRCWEQVLQQSRYQHRREQVLRYNQTHQYRKRGIVATPSQYGLSFTSKFLNQAGALVLIYSEGSVLLSHGGVEMGQGLHTKMIQVAARVLEIPHDMIHIEETATDKVPNTSATASSVSSDIYGEAVLRACATLKERLAPYQAKDPAAGWNTWVKQAYFDRVQLSATGFYATPGLVTFDFKTQQGRPFHYFSYGAAVTEVEIDCLTGDHTVLRTDIVMDVGDSLNPAIDIGQIEGGFLQGQGLVTLEELRYTPEGELITKGPGTYKLPGVSDIPCEFNVTLLRDAGWPKVVYSSKAIGEPPLVLAASVFLAIKAAIEAARTNVQTQGNLKPKLASWDKGCLNTHRDLKCEDKTAGSGRCFRLDSPATAERIRMACVDHITDQIETPEPGSFRPWDVTV
uniref:xanthine dehydrogenase n=1 Tax=Hirondellea gigas TaxID=1518452 RepID=A0A6A7FS67_9CRUS